MKAIDLKELEAVFNNMAMRGVTYGYGSKAPSLSCDTSKIKSIDCSGFSRYAIAKATDQGLIIPDGSQMQREWCEQKAKAGEIHQLKSYKDAIYANPRRLFICFIKPFTNGCGDVGHVWFVSKLDDDAVPDTMESHGGVGINSRAWNTRVLKSQAYSAFELPVK